MVLVPNDEDTTREVPTSSPSPTTATTSSDPTSIPSSTPSDPEPSAETSPGTSPETAPADDAWVFPFDEPLAPEEGDNQALAINTNDGTVTYDVAFALVWAEDDEVLNVNEAHAYASCTDCVAVAVAFQVVLIMDDAQVVVPQNLAVAANYDCHSCITAAVASQLVLSIPGEPGEEQLLRAGRRLGAAARVRAQHHVVLPDRDHRAARRLQGGDHADPGGGATGDVGPIADVHVAREPASREPISREPVLVGTHPEQLPVLDRFCNDSHDQPDAVAHPVAH